MKKREKELEFLLPDFSTDRPEIPFVHNTVHAGFTSPAEDYQEDPLDMMKLLVKNPATTFYVKVVGDCMRDEGIEEGDILVVDKSVRPHSGCLAVCWVDGEFCVRRVKLEENRAVLFAAHPDYEPLVADASNGFLIWGVVLHVVKSVRRKSL